MFVGIFGAAWIRGGILTVRAPPFERGGGPRLVVDIAGQVLVVLLFRVILLILLELHSIRLRGLSAVIISSFLTRGWP